ncbi:MAG: aminopeptidase, partial [Acetatifactor sp.]|nr:aminopeptidase [Acetatifactor sp.]
VGLEGAKPNRQYTYDHKDDHALIWDKALEQRKLEVLKTAFERYRQSAGEYAGPAVVEIFGEEPFAPESKPQAVKMSPDQQKGWVEFRARNMEINMQYIPPQERSFTIIAFPAPEIGEHFREIFEDTIRVNTLDYMKYRCIQQCLIDALDQADHVKIRGMKGNATDLTVNLWKLKNPEKETIFENCVADVNIPVGEVFTSPVLEGTDGVLHVSRVFLNGLEYKDLSITFRNGMIVDYSCGNFPEAEEGKRYIKENVLFHRETLPIGEFAIGTNTTAYVMARKWGIEEKLPILIAEKTGPHFAVGDTCYSHAEDVAVYNPDGKEIVARENEKSMLRHTDPAAAYFDCHTDITIPYDELGELTAVHRDGACIPIIREGRFVLEGSEMLNEPLEQA